MVSPMAGGALGALTEGKCRSETISEIGEARDMFVWGSVGEIVEGKDGDRVNSTFFSSASTGGSVFLRVF